MMLFCPQCKGRFGDQLLCPQCGVRLVPEQQRSPSMIIQLAKAGSTWQQTTWGRLSVGLLLAIGLYYVLRQLATAVLVLRGLGPDWWDSLSGLMTQGGLQACGLLAGGALAGAGKRWGPAYGAAIGVCCGILLLLIQTSGGSASGLMVLIYQPIILSAFGLLGGFIGSVVWKPLPILTALPAPLESESKRLTKTRKRRRSRAFDGPIAWGRVAVGVLIAVAGVIWANVILDFVIEVARETARSRIYPDQLQAQFVSWEIMVLAVLAGAGFAGATTPNGPKQGWVVGLAAGFILVLLHIARNTPAESTLGFILVELLPPGLPTVAQHLLLTVSTAILLGLLGGWFGGQLLPPVLRTRRQSLGPLS